MDVQSFHASSFHPSYTYRSTRRVGSLPLACFTRRLWFLTATRCRLYPVNELFVEFELVTRQHDNAIIEPYMAWRSPGTVYLQLIVPQRRSAIVAKEHVVVIIFATWPIQAVAVRAVSSTPVHVALSVEPAVCPSTFLRECHGRRLGRDRCGTCGTHQSTRLD